MLLLLRKLGGKRSIKGTRKLYISKSNKRKCVFERARRNKNGSASRVSLTDPSIGIPFSKYDP